MSKINSVEDMLAAARERTARDRDVRSTDRARDMINSLR